MTQSVGQIESRFGLRRVERKRGPVNDDRLVLVSACPQSVGKIDIGEDFPGFAPQPFSIRGDRLVDPFRHGQCVGEVNVSHAVNTVRSDALAELVDRLRDSPHASQCKGQVDAAVDILGLGIERDAVLIDRLVVAFESQEETGQVETSLGCGRVARDGAAEFFDRRVESLGTRQGVCQDEMGRRILGNAGNLSFGELDGVLTESHGLGPIAALLSQTGQTDQVLGVVWNELAQLAEDRFSLPYPVGFLEQVGQVMRRRGSQSFERYGSISPPPNGPCHPWHKGWLPGHS